MEAVQGSLAELDGLVELGLACQHDHHVPLRLEQVELGQVFCWLGACQEEGLTGLALNRRRGADVLLVEC